MLGENEKILFNNINIQAKMSNRLKYESLLILASLTVAFVFTSLGFFMRFLRIITIQFL